MTKLNMVKCDRCLKIFDADITEVSTTKIGKAENSQVYDLCPSCSQEFDQLIETVLKTWIAGGQIQTSTAYGNNAKIVVETKKVEEPQSLEEAIVKTPPAEPTSETKLPTKLTMMTTSEERCYKHRCDISDFERCKTCKYKKNNCPALTDPRCNETKPESDDDDDVPITKDHGGEHWRWTDKELDILYKNKHLSDKELAHLLGRSISSVSTKRSKLKITQTGLSRDVNTFTKSEELYIKTHKADGLENVAKALNRSIESVRQKSKRMGIMLKIADRKNKEWTDDEIQFIKDHYTEYTVGALSDMLNRPSNSVSVKMHALGLKPIRKGKRQKRNKNGTRSEWTEDELKFLQDFANRYTVNELEERLLEHTAETIRAKCKKLGLAYKMVKPKTNTGVGKTYTKMPFEKWKIDYIIDNHNLMSQRQLGEALGVSQSTVGRKIRELKEEGLIK